MLLKIEQTHTDISNVNYRKENHGGDKMLAADVKFAMVLPAAMMHDMVLDQPPIPFAEFFYHDPAPKEGEMFPDTNMISKRRELCIGAMQITSEYSEHKITFNTEGGNQLPMVFGEAKINTLILELKENRTVELTGRFQFLMPDDDETIGRLAEFIKRTVVIDIDPPEQVDIEDEEASNVTPIKSEEIDESDEIEIEEDPMYNQAVEIVAKHQKSGISFIQRELKVGYNRAAWIVDALEARKVISPTDEAGQRQILIEQPTTEEAESDTE